VDDAYPTGFWDHLDDFLTGDKTHIEIFVSFLEWNTWFYRSGYVKVDLIRALNRMTFDEKMTKRLQQVVLDAIQKRYTREFRYYCKLAQKVDSDDFQKRLSKFRWHEDKDIARRANWVFDYCDGVGGWPSARKEKFRLERSINHYSERIKTFPYDATNFLKRAIDHLELDNYENALADCNKALKLDYPKELILAERAKALSGLERHTECLDDINQVIGESSQRSAQYSLRARTLQALNRFEESLNDWNKAIELEPNWGPYYASKARVLRSLERNDEALSAINKAIEINPNDAYSFHVRADIFCDAKRWQDAVQESNEAIRFGPNGIEHRLQRAYIRMNLKWYDAVLEDAKMALEMVPLHPQALAYRGWAKVCLGQNDEGLADIEDALELSSEKDREWLLWIQKQCI
jgi:tetratricopeptide (TPR) repeat protein